MAVLAREMIDRVRKSPLSCEPWPEKTSIQYYWDQQIALARFPDCEQCHPRLIERTLELEQDDRFSHRFISHVGGSKIFDLEQWDCPEADLIYFRALSFFREITRSQTAASDNSWATTYHRGDYCAPHSHPRAMASVVYLLSVEKGGEEAGGEFRIADPRVPMSCQERAGYVTTPFGPGNADGTMILFPGSVVHYVEPYWGDEPRITLAWNINPRPLPEPNTGLEEAKSAAAASGDAEG